MEHLVTPPGRNAVRPPPEWHAFVNGYHRIRGDEKVVAFGDQFVKNACARWAQLIEKEAGNGG